MVAYSFKVRFAAPILAGEKRQTIRADRRRHARIGEQVQLYTGMRTRQCKLVGRATCERVEPVTVDVTADQVRRGICTLAGEALEQFARTDGFASWADMKAFWRENHPDTPVFSGVLITWRDFDPAQPGD